MDFEKSLQDQFAPNLICFGCGPANPQGLQIKSFVEGSKVLCRFMPQPHHRAYEGMINGGIIGALLDCHLCWTAAYHLMVRRESPTPPCCVTAHYGVEFQQVTPTETELIIEAWVVDASDRKAVVEGTIGPSGSVTAKGSGTFVAVKEGHPAFHRWGE
ncbi:MAG: PaaI family thioesterase [Planctomycetota bacterium]